MHKKMESYLGDVVVARVTNSRTACCRPREPASPSEASRSFSLLLPGGQRLLSHEPQAHLRVIECDRLQCLETRMGQCGGR